ncbi:hypothetical protein [Clostridium magnum]|uniref:Uncharacterized protein n=1 Tax=Clostridium magnum DSM 2767 TaxID=1121326 RepID=A0A162RAL4_9CLOT|nr:hypothetical protein [Clostridium magnum]KZL89634.1 hypothetical protein CLMAG_51340 [Clostridium magnum DSM 2767]SHH74836.1 hypothetical protein SAMN02745944_01317 [Clostridium magnum DSM 2767]
MNFLKDLELYPVYLKWREGTNAFECFLKSTTFVSLKNYPNFPLEEFSISEEENMIYNKVKTIIDEQYTSNTLFLLDVPGYLSVLLGYLLQNDLSIKPILTLNQLFHPYGLIGSKKLISNLLLCGNKLNSINPKGYIFILDSERYLFQSDGTEENFFNNQYETTEEDMPSAELLKDLCYSKAVYIYLDEIKEDINCYLDYLDHFDIKIIKCKIGEC